MICSNCGGAYEEIDLECPFCGRENEVMAERLKQEKLLALDREAEEIQKLPEKILYRSTDKILKIAGIAFGILVLVVVLGIVGSRVLTHREYVERQEQIAEIEEIYAAGDLEALVIYMDDHEVYGFDFAKYCDIGYAYRDYRNACNALDELYERIDRESFAAMSPSKQKEWILNDMVTVLTHDIDAIREIDAAIAEYGKLDDMSAIKEVRTACMTMLSGELGIEEGKIEELLALENLDMEALPSYAEQIYDQWSEEHLP